jgi:hypothetical protein
MRRLTQEALLEVWESSSGRRPVERGVAMLRALQEESEGDPARLPIGLRDARLLELRGDAFGDEICTLASCPRCGERMEARLRIDDLRLPDDCVSPRSKVEMGEYAVEFRLPASLDLLALEDTADEAAHLERSLVERCTLGFARAGTHVAAKEMPDAIADEVAKAMAEADPQANLELLLQCAACRHEWPARFDIESFLWSELEAWAARTLYEVHLLAGAYGWSERSILALSPERRSLYLSFIAE